MITQKSVQEILDTVKVEEIIQDFVSLRRRGVNLIGNCPFHHEKTPSFNVSPSKNIFKCFGCGKAGDAVTFLMEHEHFTFPEALLYIAKKYGIEVEEITPSPEAVQEQQYADSLFIINQYAQQFFHEQLFETDAGKSIGLSYFKERGFREDTMRKFGLGYTPDKNAAFTQKAVADGYNIELLRKLGLTSQNDRDFFRNRVMFTIHNLSGKPIAFAGRIMVKDAKAPKYINSPETDIYYKSKVLYGAYFAKQAIRKEDECILVEGYTDVISLHQAGIENVVASSGTSLTTDQIRLIKRYTPNVRILYDGDQAGIKAALRGVDMLLEQDLNVRIVLLPDGEDPDSYLQKVGASDFKAYIQEAGKDFILFKADLLLAEAGKDPVKKTQLLKDIIASIGRIPDPLKRAVYVKECARLFEVEEQLLVAEANKVLTQHFIHKKEKIEKDEQHPSFEGEFSDANISQQDSPFARKNAKDSVTTGDEFQEKDLVRILICYGNQMFEEEDNTTVAAYILHNIEDVMEEFDNPLYRRVVEVCMERLSKMEPINEQFFVQHSDAELSKLAIDMMTSPYEYSENWAKRWEIYLSQHDPDKNFVNDSERALKLFRFRKLKRMAEKVKNMIAQLHQQNDHEQMVAHIIMLQKINQIKNELAKKYGMVIG